MLVNNVGIGGLTESLAKELGPSNISVNAILPGLVEEPRIEGIISARADTVGVTHEAMRAQYLERISLRRMVTSGDIAAMVLFLLTPAGRNVSGQSLSVCAGVEGI